jgi:plastocyanin
MRSALLIYVLFAVGFYSSYAAEHVIGTAGNSFSPASITVQLGDNVTIQATASHPTTQVSESTWNANGTAPIGGGFTGQTSSFSFMITSLSTIYFVCENHVVSHNMKGKITVATTTGVEEGINKIGFRILNNPAGRSVFYEIGSGSYSQSTISFYDLKGGLMAVQEITLQNGRLDLGLPTGQYVYVVRSKEEELLASGKLVVTP